MYILICVQKLVFIFWNCCHHLRFFPFTLISTYKWYPFLDCCCSIWRSIIFFNSSLTMISWKKLMSWWPYFIVITVLIFGHIGYIWWTNLFLSTTIIKIERCLRLHWIRHNTSYSCYIILSLRFMNWRHLSIIIIIWIQTFKLIIHTVVMHPTGTKEILLALTVFILWKLMISMNINIPLWTIWMNTFWISLLLKNIFG